MESFRAVKMRPRSALGYVREERPRPNFHLPPPAHVRLGFGEPFVPRCKPNLKSITPVRVSLEPQSWVENDIPTQTLKQSHPSKLRRHVTELIQQPDENDLELYEDSTAVQFKDDEFPPDETSVCSSQDSPLMNALGPWCRPRDLVRLPRLFIDDANPGPITAGLLENEWFVSALTIVATRIELLHKVFGDDMYQASRRLANSGILWLFFCVHGEWNKVTIDTLLPCFADKSLQNESISDHTSHEAAQEPKQLMFMRGVKDREFWGALLEKGYAKLYGGYEKLSVGCVEDTLADLTGGIVEQIGWAESDSTNHIWTQLTTAMYEHYPVGCSCASNQQNSETKPQLDRVYAIVDAKLIGKEKMIRIRDSFGVAGRFPSWYRDHVLPQIDDQLRDRAFSESAASGQADFWLRINDFVTSFDKMYICKLVPTTWFTTTMHDRWRAHGAGGCSEHWSWCNNPQFRVSASHASRMVVILAQPDLKLLQQVLK
jgi:hypothetical protein